VSVDFDPVKVGPGRRRIDPVRALIVAVVLGLTVAIVKPWAAIPTPDAPGPSVSALVPPSAGPSEAPTPAPTTRAASTVVSTSLPAPTWDELAPVIRSHDRWGVRAILVARRASPGTPVNPRFQERWSRTTRDLDGADTAYVARDDQSVIALGVTFPRDLEGLDARIWRLHSNDELEWIDARPLDRTDRNGSFTFVRSGPDGEGIETWASGRYRIDILGADALYRIAVEIPGRFGSVPAPDAWPATEADLVGPEESDPSGVQIGPFATVDGIGVPLAARPNPPMSEEEAWRQSIGGMGGFGGSIVATAYLPRATGLGVMLTNHAVVSLAIVRRIAPDATFQAAPTPGGISQLRGRTPYVAFATRTGGAWPPGVYAITVRWTDPSGVHAQTWHVELRPGPDSDPPLAS
jgi:hypothetical protein